jgi:ABC-type transporter Mla MlaB component
VSKQSSSTPRVEKTETGLAFFGVIDFQTVPALIEAMPKTSPPDTELDLSAASKIDSAGLAFLINWGNHNLAPDQKIVLYGARAQVCLLIDIMHLQGVFELRD